MFLFGTFQSADTIRKPNLTLLFHSCHNSLDGLLEVLGADFDVRISEKMKFVEINISHWPSSNERCLVAHIRNVRTGESRSVGGQFSRELHLVEGRLQRLQVDAEDRSTTLQKMWNLTNNKNL